MGLLVAGYIAWKIFRAGNEITSSRPLFFERIRNSLLTGAFAGVINGILTGGNVAISSVSAAGVALVTLGCDVFSA